MSESEYSIEQEASEYDQNKAQLPRSRLQRSYCRNEFVASKSNPQCIIARYHTGLGKALWTELETHEFLSFRNYNPSDSQSKSPHVRRQASGKNNKFSQNTISMPIRKGGGSQQRLDMHGSVMGDEERPRDEEEKFSIFNKEIAQIIWRRLRENSMQEQYLVKYKDKSYLHTEWLTEDEMNAMGNYVKIKINRFNSSHNQRLEGGNYDQEAVEEGKYFDPSYLEVDRIINATEMFPVIHQKKANEIKGTWSQSLMLVCSKLINFTKEGVLFDCFFSQPVYPLKDKCSGYPKIITNPMDLGTIMNKIYLNIYKTYDEFWKDIGLVCKNCQKNNKEPDSDVHLLGQTLRQCTLFLYDQWFHLSNQRYQKLKEQFAHLYFENDNLENSQSLKLYNTSFNRQNNELIKDQKSFIKIQEKMDQEKLEINQNEANLVQQLNKRASQQEYQNENSAQENEEFIMGQEKMQDENLSSNNNHSKEQLSYQNEMQMQQQYKDYLDMQQFYKRNLFLTDKKVQNIINKEDIEKLNPGTFSYKWLDQQSDESTFIQYSYNHIGLNDMRSLDLNVQINRLYMVKWKNLSYSQATWQQESVISCPSKIQEFKNISKALGKEIRILMDSQKEKHKLLVNLEENPKKRLTYSNSQLTQIRNGLYFYDAIKRKQPYKYKIESPHIYKNYKILRRYQIQSLNWLIKSWYQNKNTILADEMGLGKTIQSIAFLYHLYTFQNVKGPFLIIAPLSTLQHWKRTVEQWTTMNCVLYYDQNGQSGRQTIRFYEWFHLNITMKGSTVPSELNKFQILITSYEVFIQDFNAIIMSIPFQFIIVDQAHRLKNTKSKMLTTLKKMICKRVLLLTGTPIQNNMSELWSLLNFIHPERFPSQDYFKQSFGDFSSEQQVNQLNKMLKPYMLRRMKEDVQRQIPPLQETIIDVEMTNIQKTIYKALYEKNKEMLIKGLASTNTCNANLNNLQIQLRKCCNHPFLIKELQFELLKNCAEEEERMDKLLSSSGKMVLVKKLLEKCKHQGKKVLIFSQFTHMLQLIEDFLNWKDYKYQRIDGQVKAKDRQAAIDRYNNPSKKRDVFLLSTKAGGVGINLTSANVVIIYDSDWNPQNDVQATARAHRIGQKSQVQVYRLITCNTYQTQMFSRATQKLGLDKAIFIGGNFKEAGENTHENRLSKEEMQTLLKKGILGFLQNEELGNKTETFFQQNVDEIIQNNSRIARYSLINGSCSFSKSKFVSQDADNQLKINDPNFWNLVLKNVQSPIQLLLKKLKNKEYPQNLQGQKMIMLEASEQLNRIIENKLSRQGMNTDDQVNLAQFLNIVNSKRDFHKYYRDLAISWLQYIQKPSRRFKKVTIQDLEIQSSLPPKRNLTFRNNNQQADNIFADEDQEEQDEISEQRLRLGSAKTDYLLNRLCYFCLKPKCTYYCNSYCKRSFHQECLQKIQQGYQTYDNSTCKLQINELTLDNQTLKQLIITQWNCQDCTNSLVACLICKTKGLYYGVQYKKSKKVKKNVAQQNSQNMSKNNNGKNELVKCSTSNCGKYFHPKCIEEWDTQKFFKIINKNSQHFRCSLHSCYACGDKKSILQCVRCPKALHTKCMEKDKIIKLSAKHFICQAHFKNKRDFKRASERFTNPANNLKKCLKEQKNQVKKMEIQEPHLEINQKIQPEVAHNYLTRRNRHNFDEVELLPLHDQVNNQLRQPKEKIATLSYAELGLVPIKDFNYKKYEKDWCRYCGSRYSSNFAQGPWGTKTLCNVHYLSWRKNKILNLDQYPDKPESPIDPLNDQELKYLTNIAQKYPQLTYPQVLQSLQNKRSKKSLFSI